jgi:hypothetical protein
VPIDGEDVEALVFGAGAAWATVRLLLRGLRADVDQLKATELVRAPDLAARAAALEKIEAAHKELAGEVRPRLSGLDKEVAVLRERTGRLDERTGEHRRPLVE